jgi:hypothetical protein
MFAHHFEAHYFFGRHVLGADCSGDMADFSYRCKAQVPRPGIAKMSPLPAWTTNVQ